MAAKAKKAKKKVAKKKAAKKKKAFESNQRGPRKRAQLFLRFGFSRVTGKKTSRRGSRSRLYRGWDGARHWLGLHGGPVRRSLEIPQNTPRRRRVELAPNLPGARGGAHSGTGSQFCRPLESLYRRRG